MKEEFISIENAERHAFALLNRDRLSLGLPLLILDSALSDVARGHSIEMRDSEYFAHLSPTTGLAGDRLRRARYRATSHGENLAFNDSLAEAQSSLMESVGHRRNIVEESMTHVGIGLASGETDPLRNWHLTQLFTRKVMPFDNDEVSEKYLELLRQSRQEKGLELLEVDDALMAVAERSLDGLSEMDSFLEEGGLQMDAISKKAAASVKKRVAVVGHIFYEFESLRSMNASIVDPRNKRVGYAFRRDEDDLQGRTFLVLILTE